MALAKGQSLASLQKEKAAAPGSTTAPATSAAADAPGSVINLAGDDGIPPTAAAAVPQGQAPVAGRAAGVSPAMAGASGGGAAPHPAATRPRGGKGPNYLQQRAEPARVAQPAVAASMAQQAQPQQAALHVA
ncbi:unnamed protein product, partial [Ectocarpus sp. 12 AP-2014]